jgi:hypothetical protein
LAIVQLAHTPKKRLAGTAIPAASSVNSNADTASGSRIASV